MSRFYLSFYFKKHLTLKKDGVLTFDSSSVLTSGLCFVLSVLSSAVQPWFHLLQRNGFLPCRASNGITFSLWKKTWGLKKWIQNIIVHMWNTAHFSRSVDVRNIYKLEGRKVQVWVHINGGEVAFSIFRAGTLEKTNQSSKWTLANYFGHLATNFIRKLLWYNRMFKLNCYNCLSHIWKLFRWVSYIKSSTRSSM